MFNVHLYDQKLQARRQMEQDRLHQLLIRQKQVSDRETLTANYARRVDQFIINMANDPIQLGEHIGPLAVVPRESNPAKYKGPARMILKSGFNKSLNVSRTENSGKQQRHFEYRSRDLSKELKSREFLKRGTGAQRFQAVSKAKLPWLKNAGRQEEQTAQDTAAADSLNSSRGSIPAVEEKPKQKQIFRVLHRKTHFKGVMSRLVDISTVSHLKETDEGEDNTHTFHRSRTASILWRHSKVLNRVYLKENEGSMLAKEILESCKVIPHMLSNAYLKRGEGHLTSNPQIQLSLVYKRLHESFSEHESQA